MLEYISEMFFKTSGNALALLGAFVAVILPGLGSARAVGSVGEAGAGLLSEMPDSFGPTLILQALPGTQGIYGLLVGFLILFTNPVVLGGTLPVSTGFYYLLSALPIAFCGYGSAVYQGRVALAGLGLLAKQPTEGMKGVIQSGLVETYAVLALLISVLAVFSVAGIPA